MIETIHELTIRSGAVPDNPFQFEDFVIDDGVTDLVMWRSVVENGFSVWQPIDATTVPRGLYAATSGVGTLLRTGAELLGGRAVTSAGGMVAGSVQEISRWGSGDYRPRLGCSTITEPVSRLFIIAGIHQANIAPGIVFYPTQ